jgi:hypothetical protein
MSATIARSAALRRRLHQAVMPDVAGSPTGSGRGPRHELEESTAQYLTALDAADRQESLDGNGSSGSGNCVTSSPGSRRRCRS